MGKEDLTTWTENDPNGHLSHTADRSTFTNLARTDENTYLYKNKAGLLQNFTYYFALKISSLTSATQTVRFQPFAVINALDDYQDNRINNVPQFGLQIRSSLSTTTFWFVCFEALSVANSYFDAGPANKSVGTTYYIKITKAGTSLNIYIYSDPGFTTLIETLGLILHADHNLTYATFPQSAGLATANPTSGYVENLTDTLVTPAQPGGLPIFDTLKQLNII